jgi:hypothetical protein
VGHHCCSLLFTGHIEAPDLSPCDNSLWGFLKEAVTQQRYQTPEDLKQRDFHLNVSYQSAPENVPLNMAQNYADMAMKYKQIRGTIRARVYVVKCVLK